LMKLVVPFMLCSGTQMELFLLGMDQEWSYYVRCLRKFHLTDAAEARHAYLIQHDILKHCIAPIIQQLKNPPAASGPGTRRPYRLGPPTTSVSEDSLALSTSSPESLNSALYLELPHSVDSNWPVLHRSRHSVVYSMCDGYVLKLSPYTEHESEILAHLQGAHRCVPSVRKSLSGLIFPHYIDFEVETETQLQLMISDVLSALAFLHGRGVVHRDIKRSNVRFDGSASMLIDYDLAVIMHSREPLVANVGTEGYKAPEIDGIHCYTEKVDSWSLGVTWVKESLKLKYMSSGLNLQDAMRALRSHFTGCRWRIVSQLLDPTPSTRLSPAEAFAQLERIVQTKA